MSLTPGERSLRAKAAAHAMHAKHDSRDTTRKGTAAFLASFERKVDPDGLLSPEERAKRAQSALKAHMGSLSLRGSRAATAKRKATA